MSLISQKEYDKLPNKEDYTALSGVIPLNNEIVYIHNDEIIVDQDTYHNCNCMSVATGDETFEEEFSMRTFPPSLNDNEWWRIGEDPDPIKQKLKLHLGCGNKHIDGYTNIDCRYQPGVDKIDNVQYLRSYKECSIDEIYACHVLEHVGRWNYLDTLKRWFNLLKPGAKLYIAVPDFEAIAEYYIKNKKSQQDIIGLLYGGQDYEGNIHTYCWDFKQLSIDLASLGFKDIKRYDWRETDHAHIDDFSQCYLPHMDKENGTLMSLNVVATK